MKTETLQIRITETEKRILKTLCLVYEMNQSELIRHMLWSYAEGLDEETMEIAREMMYQNETGNICDHHG